MISFVFRSNAQLLGKFLQRTFRRCQLSMSSMTLETLKLDNLALRRLPIDTETQNYIRQVPGACFSLVKPTPVKQPETVAVSLGALNLLGLGEREAKRPEFAEYFSGNKMLSNPQTASHCYCGHQFGHFSGQLGDGAAIYLGEVVNDKQERWELQLKGAGLTPFSRHADGRKVLRSSIREFLCSEAIHYLGIPTTRAGSCVTSDSTVARDIFYNGNVIREKCTIVSRIAPTFLRFGSFEIFKPTDSLTGRAGPSVGRTDILHQMLSYTIETFYPDIWSEYHADQNKMYLEFYKEVVLRTARLVAEWQCVGWCHGVLNTDNMSIIGLTIDYGPFGFMDFFDRDYICNASDNGGRYTYKKQPEICRWNCMKLGEAIQDAVPLDQTKPLLSLFDTEFQQHYMTKMRKKLGLIKETSTDKELVDALLDTMQEAGADFTNTFRCLSKVQLVENEVKEDVISYLIGQCCTVEEMKHRYQQQMDTRQFHMMIMLLETNPDLLAQLDPRHHQLLLAELQRKEKLKSLEGFTQEEKERQDRTLWCSWLEKYIARLALEDQSTETIMQLNKNRVDLMNANNPSFILRNYIAQEVIDLAEKGDYSGVNKVLQLLEDPYAEVPKSQDAKNDFASVSGGASCAQSWSKGISRTPSWALDLQVT